MPFSPNLSIAEWSALRMQLLWCYEGSVRKDHLDKLNTGRHLSAWLIEAGSAAVHRRGQTIRARAGEWLFNGPAARRQEFSPGARILSINFVLEWPSGDPLFETFLKIPGGRAPALSRAARPLARFLHRHFPNVRTNLSGRPSSLVSHFEIQRLFSTWMLAFLKALRDAQVHPSRMAGKDPRILSAVRLLERHPWEPPFEKAGLARQIGLSAGHLDRLFVREIGLTPAAYLQRRRLNLATALLADSSIPVKKIAYDLGFSSPAHFSHWFRNARGKSPRQFRNKL